MNTVKCQKSLTELNTALSIYEFYFLQKIQTKENKYVDLKELADTVKEKTNELWENTHAED